MLKAKITIEYNNKVLQAEVEADKLIDGKESRNGLVNKLNRAYRKLKREVFKK